jgi:hypothetical protein
MPKGELKCFEAKNHQKQGTEKSTAAACSEVRMDPLIIPHPRHGKAHGLCAFPDTRMSAEPKRARQDFSAPETLPKDTSVGASNDDL